jgi:hypothetical protein
MGVAALAGTACTSGGGHTNAVAASTPSVQHGAVCGHEKPGPKTPPKGAVVVKSKADLSDKTSANPPGTTFWLAPGTHTLGGGEFAQVIPKDGDTFLGAPGAVLDGQHKNDAAFTQHAKNVTIKYLTIENFVAPQDQGVVNHDSGNGWTIAYNSIKNNKGAALMAGAHQVVKANCLTDNGQYGLNAYQDGNNITDLKVIGNEIAGNNTDDWEKRKPGCGCSGGAKFWHVNGAVIKYNWVHGNHSVGLWADTNNNNFLIENNIIENNDAEAIFYEISYNAIIRDNVIRGNTIVKGRHGEKNGDDFPYGAIYISESGGDSRVPARTDKIEIYGNRLVNNWSGITLWENADRFCGSPSNTSTGSCTLVAPTVANLKTCTRANIAKEPYYSDCRWKTKRVKIHDNKFVIDSHKLHCSTDYCGKMGLLSNYGTYPDWSPYKGEVIEKAITLHQHNRWHDNTYVGPWSFVVHDAGKVIDTETWQAAPYRQDKGSTFRATGKN